MNIHLPRRLCADVNAALAREWLVTNGVGGFAAGTVAGALTRRYHGLLFAALKPPLGRTLLVAKLDETATVDGQEVKLHANMWHDGIGHDPGTRWLGSFDLVLGAPTWTFELGAARLVKRVWMEHGRSATFVRYELVRTERPVTLACRLLANYRDYHTLRRGMYAPFLVHVDGRELQVVAFDSAVSIRVRCTPEPAAEVVWTSDHTWWRDFHLPVEAARGFDHLEDHLSAGVCRVYLEPGGAATFTLAAGVDADVEQHGAWQRYEQRAQARLGEWIAGEKWGQSPVFAQRQTPPACDRSAKIGDGPHFHHSHFQVPVQQLVLAADQFIVARTTPDEPEGRTIMAGYPWFTDWGRDTMVALPGLTLVTGRYEIARQILRTWARYVDGGLIPNRFPDAGDPGAPGPEYHTADATLWYLWAIDQYVRATGDVQTLAELLPVMVEIIDWHRRGTRHHIHVGDDGLVYAADEGVNLTWMDAKVAGRVITPRMGKPVELSALWYDALCNMARLARLLDRPETDYVRWAETTRTSFARFWNADRGCCYDVIDGPDGPDGRLRPNQIFAVALTHSALPAARQRALVDVCEQKLLTPFGLRTLASGEPGYRGRYAGNPSERDEAYHQGPVWGWLLGPFVLAHYRVYQDVAQARSLLEPMLGQLWTHGVGSLSEIFDGDWPHEPNGCVAQAWSVAETLRAWCVTQGYPAQAEPRP